MSTRARRLVYVISYELIAVVIVTLALAALGFSGGGSTLVAVASSTVALIWNYAWNTLFEAWEARQDSQVRTLHRRIVHAIGFEGGLIVFLVPVMALILRVSLLEALILEAGFLVFFLIYTFCFAWIFDKVLPPWPKRDSSYRSLQT